MFLGAYRFRGDPETLTAAYDRLMAEFGEENSPAHLCVVGEGELTILDACPSEEVFAGFSSGPDFAAALARAGLPEPVIEPLGTVHRAWVTTPIPLRRP